MGREERCRKGGRGKEVNEGKYNLHPTLF